MALSEASGAASGTGVSRERAVLVAVVSGLTGDSMLRFHLFLQTPSFLNSLN